MAAVIDRLRESADHGGAVTLTRLDCRRLLVLLGAPGRADVCTPHVAIEDGFQVDDRGAGGRCQLCGWMVIRGAGETEEELRERIRLHAARHRERALLGHSHTCLTPPARLP